MARNRRRNFSREEKLENLRNELEKSHSRNRIKSIKRKISALSRNRRRDSEH